MEFKKSNRGFNIGLFKDLNGEACSIQESSLATEEAIWIGINNANPQIMSSTAIKMGLRERTFDENDNGFVPYPIPDEVIMSTRMHLTREMVADLLPILSHFVQTGEL